MGTRHIGMPAQGSGQDIRGDGRVYSDPYREGRRCCSMPWNLRQEALNWASGKPG